MLIAGCVLAVVALAAWWSLRPKAAVVRTVPAREVACAGSDLTVLNASGYVTARREATVSSKVTGKVVFPAAASARTPMPPDRGIAVVRK